MIKWDCVLSYTFAVKFGVRQSSVLSPFLFAIYLDDIPVNRSLIPSSFVVMYANITFAAHCHNVNVLLSNISLFDFCCFSSAS